MMRLIRQRNADHCVVEWARAQVGAQYVYGQSDCLTLALDAIAVQTRASKHDLRVGVRPYSTRYGALRAAKEAGGFDAFFGSLGLTAVNPRYAHVGDIGVGHEGRGTGSALVYLGDGCWLYCDEELGVRAEFGIRPTVAFRVV